MVTSNLEKPCTTTITKSKWGQMTTTPITKWLEIQMGANDYDTNHKMTRNWGLDHTNTNHRYLCFQLGEIRVLRKIRVTKITN